MKDDTISRAAALDFIDSMNWCDEISDEAFKKITIHLENLPSAQQWIPCSTALPSKYDNYLITTEDGMVVFGVYDPRERQWCRYDKIKSWWLYGIKVLAWMPLPKPWEGGQDEQN